MCEMIKLEKCQKNKTTILFFNLCQIIYYCTSTNFWVEDIQIPSFFDKFLKSCTRIIHVASYGFIALEIGAFYSQHNLSEKHNGDRFLLSFCHIFLLLFCVILNKYKDRVSKLLFVLSVELKKPFNDEKIEMQMIKKTKLHLIGFAILCVGTLGFYGVDALWQVLNSDKTFVTVIPYWPDVNDRSTSAGIARVALYIFWWLFLIKIFSAYILLFCVTIALSHQYINLQRYFRNLTNIFKTNISQKEKEENYVKALKIGVQLHATTIWCSQEVQKTFGPVFSGQIFINIMGLVQIMSQMVDSERTISNTISIMTMTICVLFSTGIIMCNAGDVTIEASRLPLAMFLSGWQHCQNRSSYRIRRLLLIAITQGQKPVEIQSLGIVTISYQSYLSIVKTSYSLFSVLY